LTIRELFYRLQSDRPLSDPLVTIIWFLQVSAVFVWEILEVGNHASELWTLSISSLSLQ